MVPYNILILGSGGREHAIAAHTVKSPLCNRLFIAPGNAGTAEVGQNLPFAATDYIALKKNILEQDIRMVIIGPEDPLAQGIADKIHADSELQHVLVFGPGAEGAQLEGSKAFAKRFMMKAGIPTASYREFSKDQLDETIEYLRSHPLPIVIKADGLAAGKGVIIAPNVETGIDAVREIFGGQFGTSGDRIVIESFLDGIEFSVFIATNGEEYVLLPVAKDYKKIFDEDKGPNTGGMGAVSPVPFVDNTMMIKVTEKIIRPTLAQLKQDNIPYTGFIFFGLIAVGGDPYVIEYNVRMGDPETEVVFPRIKSDMIEIMEKLILHKPLPEMIIESDYAVGVYLVSNGYPGDYEKGKAIDVDSLPEYCTLYHGGTKQDESGTLVSNGGRVIFSCAKDSSLTSARRKALEGADSIVMDGKFYRRDIGLDLDH
ncbi:MAG TPA: phosphoribosylamine--glycine ligase [Saprospiraceae bacterium]|nr:phosphoribosylamine--glycine ligase [Saprospiraceae bacterium]